VRFLEMAKADILSPWPGDIHNADDWCGRTVGLIYLRASHMEGIMGRLATIAIPSYALSKAIKFLMIQKHL
jgi:hypothetical protein